MFRDFPGLDYWINILPPFAAIVLFLTFWIRLRLILRHTLREWASSRGYQFVRFDLNPKWPSGPFDECYYVTFRTKAGGLRKGWVSAEWADIEQHRVRIEWDE